MKRPADRSKPNISRRQAPKAIADILAVATRRPDLKAKFERYAAFPHWEEIVGAEIAKVAIPEKIIRKRVLVVRVVDSTWAQELSLIKEDLIAKVASFEKGAQIEEIKFLTGSPRSFPTRTTTKPTD